MFYSHIQTIIPKIASIQNNKITLKKVGMQNKNNIISICYL